MLQELWSAEGSIAQQVMRSAHEPVAPAPLLLLLPPPLPPLLLAPPLLLPPPQSLAQDWELALMRHWPAALLHDEQADDMVHLPAQVVSPG
jgi:hypothetical protein